MNPSLSAYIEAFVNYVVKRSLEDCIITDVLFVVALALKKDLTSSARVCGHM